MEKKKEYSERKFLFIIIIALLISDGILYYIGYTDGELAEQRIRSPELNKSFSMGVSWGEALTYNIIEQQLTLASQQASSPLTLYNSTAPILRCEPIR